MPGGEDVFETTGSDDRSEEVREAFALLGHEVRLDILLALLEDWRGALTEPRSYSELMRAVGMQDSGKFNYHLSRLRGSYVRKVDDGYVPTASATALYRAVLATRPSADPAERSFAVEGSCPDCGGDLTATYEREFLTVTCDDCETVAGGVTYPFPRNGFDERSGEAVVDAVGRRAAHHVALARSGQCPFCAGTTTPSVLDDLDDPSTPDVEIACDTCSFVVAVRLLLALELVPEVTAALVALGVDFDESDWGIPERTVEVRSRDPTVVELTVERDGRTATVVVDDGLDVRSVTVDGDPVGGP
jgi:DNA-binding transcriptional ArsR family regulator